MNRIESARKLLKPFQADSNTQSVNAAVAVLLRLVDKEIEVLLVKRIEKPSDAWSGQIALPGGRRDESDRSLEETVVREVLEEVNVNITDRCRVLGVMPIQKSSKRPKIKVLPFVVLVEYDPKIKLNKKELESYFWASLKELVQSRGVLIRDSREVPIYVLGKYVVWGITYRILNNLIRLLSSRSGKLSPNQKSVEKC